MQCQESQLAHELAQRHREEPGSHGVSKMSAGVAAEVSQLSAAALRAEDYANTRFHSSLVVRHEQQFVQEEIEKLKKGAFDKAREE